jgi:hypothetical protein
MQSQIRNNNLIQEAMKKFNYVLFFGLALTMSVSSCKKDESTPDGILTTAEFTKKLVTAVPWQLISDIENYVAVAVPACEQDDYYTFSTDGTYSHNVGTQICHGETNSSGTWTLAPDVHNIFVDGKYMGTVTTTKLVLSEFDNDENVISERTFIPKCRYCAD